MYSLEVISFSSFFLLLEQTLAVITTSQAITAPATNPKENPMITISIGEKSIFSVLTNWDAEGLVCSLVFSIVAVTVDVDVVVISVRKQSTRNVIWKIRHRVNSLFSISPTIVRDKRNTEIAVFRTLIMFWRKREDNFRSSIERVARKRQKSWPCH